MKRTLLALLLCAPLPVLACDLTYSTVVSYKGAADYSTARGWKNLDAADLAMIQAKGNSIVAAAQNAKGAGDYSIVFNQSGGCDTKADDSETVSGLTLNDVNKLARLWQKLESDLIKMGEDAHGKGKKRAWGKD